ALRRELREKSVALNETIAKLEQTEKLMKKTVDDTSQQVSTLDAQKLELEEKLKDKEARLYDLGLKLEIESEAKKESTHAVDPLRMELREKSVALTTLSDQLRLEQTERASVRKRLEEAMSELERSNLQLTVQNGEILGLKSAKLNLEGKVSSLEQCVADSQLAFTRRVNELQAMLTAEQSAQSSNAAGLQSAQGVIDNLTAEKAYLERELVGARNDKNVLEIDLGKAMRRAQELEEYSLRLQKEAKDVQELVVAKTIEASDARSVANSLRNELSAVRQAAESVVGDKAAVKEQLEATIQRLSASQQSTEVAQQHWKNAASETKEKQRALEFAAKQMEQLHLQIAEQQDQFERLKESATNASRDAAVIREGADEDIQRMERERRDAQASLQTAQANLQTTQDQLRLYERLLDESESSSDALKAEVEALKKTITRLKRGTSVRKVMLSDDEMEVAKPARRAPIFVSDEMKVAKPAAAKPTVLPKLKMIVKNPLPDRPEPRPDPRAMATPKRCRRVMATEAPATPTLTAPATTTAAPIAMSTDPTSTIAPAAEDLMIPDA
ncbi:hypothetical protein HDU96_005389, partial [Phlyctochytrium bullatum]